MSKNLVRIVALLLTPCLAADPAVAHGFTLEFLRAGTIPLNSGLNSYRATFAAEAFQEPLVVAPPKEINGGIMGAEIKHQLTAPAESTNETTRYKTMVALVQGEGEPATIGASLYKNYIARKNILQIKRDHKIAGVVAAAENDQILQWLREERNPRLKAIYDAIESTYLQHVQDFVDSEIAPRAFTIDRLDVVPLDLYLAMVREGLIGTQFKQTDGGLGLSSEAWLRVNAMVSQVSSGVTLGALNVLGSLGPDPLERPLDNLSADAQRHEVLVKLFQGEALVTFSLTEPEAGSDSGGMETAVIENRLEGKKIFITVGMVLPADYEDILRLPTDGKTLVQSGSPEAVVDRQKVPAALWSHYALSLGSDVTLWMALRQQVETNVKLYKSLEHWQTVAARTEPKNKEKPHAGVKALLIPMKAAETLPEREKNYLIFKPPKGGVIKARKENVIGQRGSGTTFFEYEQVPVDLEQDTVGSSLKLFLETLSRGRFTISAHGLGVLQGLRRTLEVAVQDRERQEWDENVLNVARAQIEKLKSLDLLYDHVLEKGAELKDAGADIKVPAALAKILVPEAAHAMAAETLDVLAHLGYRSMDPEITGAPLPFARPYAYAAMRQRDVPLLNIGEGTTNIQRHIVNDALLGSPEKSESDYAAELKTLESDMLSDPMARVIAGLVRIRNEAVSIYRPRYIQEAKRRKHRGDAEPVHVDPEAPPAPLETGDIVFRELPALEGRLQTLLINYQELRQRKTARQEIAPLQRALAWYLSDTLRWLNQNDLQALPERVQEVQRAQIHQLTLEWSAQNRTVMWEAGPNAAPAAGIQYTSFTKEPLLQDVVKAVVQYLWLPSLVGEGLGFLMVRSGVNNVLGCSIAVLGSLLTWTWQKSWLATWFQFLRTPSVEPNLSHLKTAA